MLPEQKAIEILKIYEGYNNYILQCKEKLFFTKGYKPSRSQADYINKHHKVVPKVAKKWVDLDPYFSEKIRNEKLLPTAPKQIWVQKLLVETDKAFHIYGKFNEKSPLEFFWIPKSAILKNDQKKVDINWDKYSHRPPLEHQKKAIEKLVGHDKFILADDMGLGKTTSATIASVETGVEKVLLICPASLKLNWKRELCHYVNEDDVGIVEGKNWVEGKKYVIINYDILKNFHTLPKKGTDEVESVMIDEEFDLVIIDEAHYISNKKAQRTKLVNHIVNHIGRVWLLTGTPMTSRPINYFNLLELVDSPLTINWAGYVRRYCDGYQFFAGGRKIWNTNGASNLEELRERTKPHVLRRLKDDVIDLPGKIITPVFMETTSKEYKKEIGDYIQWEKTQKKKSLSVSLAKLMKARQVIANEKLQHTYELIESSLAQDKKVIVFTNFTSTLEEIHWKYHKIAVKLNGQMSKKDRQASVDKFQTDDKCKIFVGNIKAAGVGITLTEAEVVIFNDLSFVPSDHTQAEDRAYRYGQKNKVSIYYPVFENTIDMVVYNILQRKKNIIDTVMGDNENDDSLMEELLKELNKE